MNIYDDVNNLVQNLKKDEKTIKFKEVRDKLINNDKELYEKILEFQKINIEINTDELIGKEVDENKKAKSKQIYKELSKNEKALEYFTREVSLNQMIEEVNKIFMNGIREIYN